MVYPKFNLICSAVFIIYCMYLAALFNTHALVPVSAFFGYMLAQSIIQIRRGVK